MGPAARRLLCAFLLVLVAGAAAARGTASSAAQRIPADAPRYVPGTVLVRLKPAAAAAAAAAAASHALLAGLQLVGLQGEHHSTPAGGSAAGGGASSKAPAAAAAAPLLPTGAVLRFRITDATSVEAKVAQLRANAAVAAAQPDYLYYPQRVPKDRFFPPFDVWAGLWHLRAIQAPQAWDTTTGSKAIKVCMVDTGATPRHEDLAANIAGGWDRAVHGLEAAQQPWQPKAGTAAYRNFTDVQGHGTHTAGLVGAAGNNGLGVAGVNWRVSLYICKAAHLGGFASSSLLDCYSLCRRAGARVVSASYGGPAQGQLEQEAISKLRDAGILFVAAAGNGYASNDDAPTYPASTPLDNVLSVAATNADDSLARYSNWGGQSVHLAAPGSNVMSAFSWIGELDSYAVLSGTSMSTPLVAGAAALLAAAKPTATYAAIRDALLASIDPIPMLRGRVRSGGRLNVARALARLLALPNPPPPTEPAYTFLTMDDVALSGGFEQRVLGNASSSQACQAACQAQTWCWFAVYYPTAQLVSTGQNAASWANCHRYDASFTVTDFPAITGAVSAYRQLAQPGLEDLSPPLPPLPPQPPARPLPGSWDNPLPVSAFPFLSTTVDSFPEGLSPVPCSQERAYVRVFRWFSGARPPGQLVASSCGSTTGSVVLSVLSSPNQQGGPYKCVGGSGSAEAACPDTWNAADSFHLAFRFAPQTYYFLAVAPKLPIIGPESSVRLHLRSLAVSPPPPVAPPARPAALGAWANPRLVPEGPGGLPYLSPNISVFVAPNPRKGLRCDSLASDRSVVFRWFSGAVLPGTPLEVSGCNRTTGDTVLSVYSTPSASPAPLDWYCEDYNDDQQSCASNQKGALASGSTVALQPFTFYWFAIAPHQQGARASVQLRFVLPACSPVGSWAAPQDVPALPFVSGTLCGFAAGAPPVACTMGRPVAAVFRWFSGNSTGRLQASSCGTTTSGDPVVSVLASPRKQGGPFACVGGNDDGDGCRGNSPSQGLGAFHLELELQPNTFYFFAVAPYNATTDNLPQLRFRLATLLASPPRKRTRRPAHQVNGA